MSAARRKIFPATSIRRVSKHPLLTAIPWNKTRRSRLTTKWNGAAVSRIGLCEYDSEGNYHGITEIWDFTKVPVW